MLLKVVNKLLISILTFYTNILKSQSFFSLTTLTAYNFFLFKKSGYEKIDCLLIWYCNLYDLWSKIWFYTLQGSSH